VICLVCFLPRRPDLTPEVFYEHWEQRHGPLIAGTPSLARHIVRYEQLRRTTHAPWMGSEGFDGITVQWMTGPDAFEAFLAEPAYAELIAPDEERFLDRSRLVWMITEPPRLVFGAGVAEGGLGRAR
jgi:hypothetical protein